MPVVYNIDIVSRVVRTTCSSPLAFSEVIDHFRTLQADPSCSGRLDVLLDLSSAFQLPETSQFSAITGELGAIRDKVQFGALAVVASNDAMFGMMRMFEVLAHDYFRATRVFRGPAEAQAWLAAQQSDADNGDPTSPPRA